MISRCLKSVVILLLVVSCCACGGKEEQNQEITTKETQESVVEKKNYQRKAVAAAGNFSYALSTDGKVLCAGKSENKMSGNGHTQGMPDTSGWQDMVYVYANDFVVCGMDKDGKLYGDGMEDNSGEGTVPLYTDNRQIISGISCFTILNNQGKLICVAGKFNPRGYTKMYSLTSDVAYITGGDTIVAALNEDGKVIVFCDDNEYGQVNVGTWTDIVDIACGYNYTVGLKEDGTVVATGDNTYGQCDVSGWTDIVSVAAGSCTTIGLKSDGTVVATGDNTKGQCDVSGWTDIVSVVTSGNHTLGIKKDGTAVATGDNTYGQCDVSGWSNIRIPEGLE